MRLSDFDYPLPDELIAQSPAEPRDSARLLVDRGADTPLHRQVRDLCEFLRPDDLLVVNDTRVIPARLRLSRGTGGAAEVLLLEPVDSDRRVWEAMVRPARKLRVGEVLFSASSGDPVVAIVGRTDAGDTMHVELQGEGEPLDVLTRHGEMPLPPYITSTSSEPERYQTVYARQPSSSAAPTAGLHFTPSLLEQVAALGVAAERVELVVGQGGDDLIEGVALGRPGAVAVAEEGPGEVVERLAPVRLGPDQGVGVQPDQQAFAVVVAGAAHP